MANFNIGFLRAVKNSIHESLEGAEKKCVALAEGSVVASKFDAHTEIHKAIGALKMIELGGCTLVASEVERLAIATRDGQTDIMESSKAMIEALSAIRRYLDDLLDGAKDLPARLFSQYKKVKMALKETKISALDLFFPDFDVDLNSITFTPQAPAVLEKLVKAERPKFQVALVQWMKHPADKEIAEPAIHQMRAVIDSLGAIHARKGYYLFWIASSAFMHLLPLAQNPAQASEMRAVISKIDTEMRKFAENTKKPSDDAFRAVLFHLAQASNTGLAPVEKARQLFGLDVYWEEVQKGVKESESSLHLINTDEIKEILSQAKDELVKLSSGAGSAVKYEQLCAALAAKITSFQNPAVKKLSDAILFVANKISNRALKLSDIIAEEMAFIFVLLEGLIEKRGRTTPDFDRQVEHEIKRLSAAIKNEVSELAKLETPEPDEQTRRDNERNLIRHAVTEVKADLAVVEEALDTFFRSNGENREELSTVMRPLKMAAGAIKILNLKDATRIMDALVQIIENVVQGGTPNEREITLVTDGLGGITLFLEAYQDEDTQAQLFLDSALELFFGDTASDAHVQSQTDTIQVTQDTTSPAAAEPEFSFDFKPEQAIDSSSVLVDASVVDSNVVDVASTHAEEISNHIAVSAPVAPASSVAITLASVSEGVKDTSSDDELAEVYLEETQEIFENINAALDEAIAKPSDKNPLITLRRAYHTLKGSGRMVGLNALGDAAYAIESFLNKWIAEDKTATKDVITMIRNSTDQFRNWVEELRNTNQVWVDARSILTMLDALNKGQSVADAFEQSQVAPIALDSNDSDPTHATNVIEVGEDADEELLSSVDPALDIAEPHEVPSFVFELPSALPSDETAVSSSEDLSHEPVDALDDLPVFVMEEPVTGEALPVFEFNPPAGNPEEEISLDHIEVLDVDFTPLEPVGEFNDQNNAPVVMTQDEVFSLDEIEALPQENNSGEIVIDVVDLADVNEHQVSIEAIDEQNQHLEIAHFEESSIPQNNETESVNVILPQEEQGELETVEVLENVIEVEQEVDLQSGSDSAKPSVVSDTVIIGSVTVPKALFDIFCIESNERLASLESDVKDLATSGGGEAPETMMRAAHTMGSIGRTLKFPVLAELGSTLESWVQDRVEHQALIDKEEIPLLEITIARLKEIILEIQAGREPSAATLEVEQLKLNTEFVRQNRNKAFDAQSSISSVEAVEIEVISEEVEHPMVAQWSEALNDAAKEMGQIRQSIASLEDILARLAKGLTPEGIEALKKKFKGLENFECEELVELISNHLIKARQALYSVVFKINALILGTKAAEEIHSDALANGVEPALLVQLDPLLLRNAGKAVDKSNMDELNVDGISSLFVSLDSPLTAPSESTEPEVLYIEAIESHILQETTHGEEPSALEHEPFDLQGTNSGLESSVSPLMEISEDQERLVPKNEILVSEAIEQIEPSEAFNSVELLEVQEPVEPLEPTEPKEPIFASEAPNEQDALASEFEERLEHLDPLEQVGEFQKVEEDHNISAEPFEEEKSTEDLQLEMEALLSQEPTEEQLSVDAILMPSVPEKKEESFDMAAALGLDNPPLNNPFGFDFEIDPSLVPDEQDISASSHISKADEPAFEISVDAKANKEARLHDLLVQMNEESKGTEDDLDETLLPMFTEEAQEILPRLDQLVRELKSSPHDKVLIGNLHRDLHTLKGSAKMVGALKVGDLVHHMETIMSEVEADRLDMDAVLEILENQVDNISAITNQIINPTAPAVKLVPLVVPTGSNSSNSGPVAVSTAMGIHETPEARAELKAQRAVKVETDVIDRLVNEAGEVRLSGAALAGSLGSMRHSIDELGENTKRLSKMLRELEVQTEGQMAARKAQAVEEGHDFDPLEFDRFTRAQELARFLTEGMHDIIDVQSNLDKITQEQQAVIIHQDQMSSDIQQTLMNVRLVQFDTIENRLYGVVRQTARELDKKVKLDILGGKVEIDRGVLDRVTAPLEHILRNAVNHGIESPKARIAQSKSEIGHIKVSITHEGNFVEMRLSDDGHGLNLKRIREKGIEKGFITAEESLSEQRLIELIFLPGFSTAETITQIAGRGVGMDVVKNEIVSLGGQIEIVTEEGKGMTFIINLPVSLATTQAILVEASGQLWAIPTDMIEEIRSVKLDELDKIYKAGAIKLMELDYPFYYLPHLLGERGASAEQKTYNNIILAKAGDRQVSLHVDRLLGTREIVVKNIGRQMARISGISGATVLGDGRMGIIINPVYLAKSRKDQLDSSIHITPVEQVIRITRPTVMVIDDSLTIRKATSKFLERSGYDVMLAKDGIDALERLQDRLPDVILCDVEMPRMDGFELLKNLKADLKYKVIPVAMITSRTADKHRNHAMSLGADVYLGKPYKEDELLEHIKNFLGQKAAV